MSNEKRGDEVRTTHEHTSRINIDNEPQLINSTGIVCTIGPSCQTVEQLEQLMANGLNIARLNFSHGSYEYHQQTIDNVRRAAESIHPCPVGIALDTKGPEIRTGIMKNGTTVTYKKGQDLMVSCDPSKREECGEDQQYLDYPSLVASVKPGSDIVIADGNFLLTVKEIIDEKNIMTTVLNDATIGDRKNCNLPGAIINLPAVSDKDRADIQFAVKNKLDMIFCSFIRKRQDVLDIRAVLGDEGKDIKVISKIENHEGIVNINEIIDVTDGVMVARGDMGMEIPLQKVFLAQKMIIARCNTVGKPVICATQMLESMINNPRPTRAEITDVGNAVVDGADCVMLSGETASGKYPAEAVSIMNKICKEAVSCIFNERRYDELKNAPSSSIVDMTECTAIAAVGASFTMNASAIIVCSTTGRTAWLLSHYRPKCPIILVTRDPHVARVCHLYQNLMPLVYTRGRKERWEEDVDDRLEFAIQHGRKIGILGNGSCVIHLSGYKPGSNANNAMRVLNIQDNMTQGKKVTDFVFSSDQW